MWNVRGLYRAGQLMTVAKEISEYELDLVGVQEVRWDRGGTELVLMFLSSHQNAEQYHDIKIANRCFENVVDFIYLGTTVTNQNLIQEEITKRLNSGNAC
jgi:hypothetical protein